MQWSAGTASAGNRNQATIIAPGDWGSRPILRTAAQLGKAAARRTTLTCTTQLYRRRSDHVSLDEAERIVI
jgi:hypothetical protein